MEKEVGELNEKEGRSTGPSGNGLEMKLSRSIQAAACSWLRTEMSKNKRTSQLTTLMASPKSGGQCHRICDLST